MTVIEIKLELEEDGNGRMNKSILSENQDMHALSFSGNLSPSPNHHVSTLQLIMITLS